MNKTIAIVPLAAALLGAGCATKEMKSTPFYEGTDVAYTGAPEDRVNIWPVAYWRAPVGSVAWPVVSFSDDHFALRPVYSQYRQTGREGAFDEFNFVWPVCQADTKNDDYRLFPAFWGKDGDGKAYQTLFPIYWNGATYNSLFPLYVYRNQDGARRFSALAGLIGASADADGWEDNWLFPLWYWNRNGTFMTAVYGRWQNGWALPPLLSWGESEDNGDFEHTYLLGFGGVKKRQEALESWAWPLYSRNSYRDAQTNDVCETDVLLDLVEWRSKNGRARSSYVFPLYSWYRDESLLTPLFYWENDGTFLTWLGGRSVDCDNTTTNVCVTPFFGASSGQWEGGWAFPLWSHTKKNDFCDKLKLLDCDSLPESIKIWTEETTNAEGRIVIAYKDDTFYSMDRTSWLLLCELRQSVLGNASLNSYEIKHRISRGNGLVCKYGYERTLGFDRESRAKLSDKEESESSLLMFLYNYDRHADRLTGDSYVRHRVLWRLWDWECRNGDVALDVFPGFTYDAKADGFRKVSLFWRLFRYERDPADGTAVDLLFLPIWR